MFSILNISISIYRSLFKLKQISVIYPVPAPSFDFNKRFLRVLCHEFMYYKKTERTIFFLAKKQKRAEPELTDFEVPTSFWWEFKYLSESLVENVNGEFHRTGHVKISMRCQAEITNDCLFVPCCHSLCHQFHRKHRASDPADHLPQEETHPREKTKQGYHGISDISELSSWSQVRMDGCV